MLSRYEAMTGFRELVALCLSLRIHDWPSLALKIGSGGKTGYMEIWERAEMSE